MSNAVYPSQIHGFTYTVLRTPEFATIVQKSPGGSEVRVPQMQNPTWHITLIYDYLYGQYNSPQNTMPYAPYSDIDTLVGFYLARQGQSDDFLWIDPKNNAVGPAVVGASPNLQAELALVDDGLGHYYSPVQRLVGGLYYEDITDLNGNIQVYANGVIKSGYTIVGPGYRIPGYSWRGLVLKWTDTAASWASTHAYTTTGWQILDTNGHIQQVTTAGTSGASMPVWNSSGGTTTDGTVTWTDQGYYAGPTRPITAQFNYYFRMRFETDTQDFEQFMDELYTIGGSESKNGSGMLKLMTSRSLATNPPPPPPPPPANLQADVYYNQFQSPQAPLVQIPITSACTASSVTITCSEAAETPTASNTFVTCTFIDSNGNSIAGFDPGMNPGPGSGLNVGDSATYPMSASLVPGDTWLTSILQEGGGSNYQFHVAVS
jgi:hypothetical protein